MLQIITEKFFPPGDRYETLHRAIFYTNYRVMRGEKIITPVGTLLPSSGLHSLATLTCEMLEKQEKHPDGPRSGVFIATSGDDLLNDFAAVISFFLNVTCTPDPDLTRRLLLAERPSLGIEAVPSRFIRRMFDKDVHARDGEAAALAAFITQLIGVERETFVGAMRAIRQFVIGSHRLADDLNLAYTLFVTSIESLAQGFDGHVAEWSDYDSRKRNKIDDALKDASDEVAAGVRDAVLSNEHVALARRFRDFAMAHVAPSFFREEAAGAQGPIGRPDLPTALQQAYTIRSGYVHLLRDVPRQLTMSGFPEATEVDDKETLSFAGLSRLARHIIMQFVARGRTVERETFDYRKELPGIVTVRLSPEYWVASTGGFDHKTAPVRLAAFLEQITAAVLLRQKDAKLTDLRPILTMVEDLVPGLRKPSQRLPMLTLYFLFHQFAGPEFSCKQWPALFEKYKADFDAPTVESFVAHLITGHRVDWTLEQFEDLHKTYFKTRHTAGVTKIGLLLEAAMSLYLAEVNRAAGNDARARALVAFAVDCNPGHATLRAYEASLPTELVEIDWASILLPPRPKNEGPPVDPVPAT
ncbi:hypothetical protein HU675_0000415 [Bradyrhizobium septentrionale]|uniref:hypothetical protein n=1 Tax=Bradyrhizobium septentrionale TaxID=1404411 RepID=UPI001596973E|nr:hypothetical protein [Bradyrhizobium septentrionale]UGY25454.1 hypothetical protein HU675_0000415 [Bradyrhizobium septentrionale]